MEIDHAERRNLLESIFPGAKDIPHAFLLIGPKGTGNIYCPHNCKVLNCEENVCWQSKRLSRVGNVTRASAFKTELLDLFELDGASNRGIDDVRALRESGYASARGRYKV